MKKKVLMITKYYYPHIGGVEKHVNEISKILMNNYDITILTEKYLKSLPITEVVNNIKIVRITYPHIKIFGLVILWIKILKHIKLILSCDIVHIHDVFIWYLPIKILFPMKPVFLTIHGWEGTYPIPLIKLLMKKLSYFFSRKTLLMGKYITKHYKINGNIFSYGGINKSILVTKINRITYIGRLQNDTGLKIFLKTLEKFSNIIKFKIYFVGEGELKRVCEKYGKVIKPTNQIRKYYNSKIIIASGYLTILESLYNKCITISLYNNVLRKDYLIMSPFKKYIYLTNNSNQLMKIIKNCSRRSFYKNNNLGHRFASKFTWKKVSDIYNKMWKQ